MVKAHNPKNRSAKKVEAARLRVLMKRLWKNYVRKHIRTIAASGALMVVSSGLTSVQPLLIQQAFDRIFDERSSYYLVMIPLAIIVVFIMQALTIYFSNYFMGNVMNGVISDMRKALFTHVIDNEVEFHSNNDSGSLLSRITAEIIHIANSVTHFFNAWCRQVITSIGLFAVMVYQSLELTLVSMVAFGIAFIPLSRITTRLKKLTRQLNDKNADLNSRLIESLTGVRTVKAFSKEAFEIRKISDYVEEIEEASNKTNMIGIITAPLMQIVGGLAVAFVIWFGGHQLIEGNMTKGNLVAFIAALTMFSRPIRSLSTVGNVMVKGYIAADRFYEMMDIRPRYVSRDHGKNLQLSGAEVTFQNVGFNYPNGKAALSGVSFTAQAGKKTALVGHSGSGKSTIFNLIMKFYEPTTGTISIDGQNLSEASINSAREHIALVSQDIFIFDETAMNNIGYGREGSTEEEIIAAAKAARCHDFIMQLPNGYNTRLGFAGESLSGGQKQRIAIARAFLRDAPILLLDEATSALDPRTEADVQYALDELSKNRTTIIIAHRLSTVISADHMILMDDGRIAETGTHESLVKESASYRNHFGI